MSNYYISKCCKVPTDYKNYYPNVDKYTCPKCGKTCEVIAMLDTPGGVPKADESVKAYQEDIEAGVDVSGVTKEEGQKHPEHICRFNDYPQSCECYDKGYEKCKIEMLSTIKGLKCNLENDSLTIARILNELQ
jgi:hypothetical protein